MSLEKLHLACSMDCLRPAMHNVKIEGRYAIATDGHVLVKVAISDIINIEALDGCQIPQETWKELCRASMIDCRKEEGKNPVIRFLVNDQQYEYTVKEAEDEYPDTSILLKEYRNTLQIRSINKISFNPSLIDRVKKACGIEYHSHMNVLFFGDNKGFLITSDFIEGFALVMPVMTHNEPVEKILIETKKHF